MNYFTVDPTGPFADADEEQIDQFLARYAQQRKEKGTAFIPDGLTLNKMERLTPEELQLVGAQTWVVQQISRLTGIAPSWLSLEITSRTYTNSIMERQDWIDLPAAPYISAIEERLSLGDCTPRGQRVRFVLDAFLRSDTLSRYQAYTAGLAGGWLTVPEVRELEGLPPLNSGETNA
jgi:phage portal protein BeeE